MKMKVLVVALITGLFLAGSGVAQTSKGILVGVARDATGAVVPNAKVTIVGNSDHATRTIATKSDGSYRLEALDPETYTVTVHQPGFQGFAANNVIVEPSLVTTYDITLSVGSIQDTVNVEADSLSINTENGQLTGTIGKTDITKLPIFTVSPYELATTLPGVQIVDNTINAGFSNGINIQVNGARPRNITLNKLEILGINQSVIYFDCKGTDSQIYFYASINLLSISFIDESYFYSSISLIFIHDESYLFDNDESYFCATMNPICPKR